MNIFIESGDFTMVDSIEKLNESYIGRKDGMSFIAHYENGVKR